MPEVAKVTVEAPENPPNPASVSSNETQAETVIQAAIQTGAAAEKTEQAAAKAETAATQAKSLAEELKASLLPELEKISERLAALETMEEEELEEQEENGSTSNSQEIAGAEIVELNEPPAPKQNQANMPNNQPAPEKKGRGNILKRVFLNR